MWDGTFEAMQRPLRSKHRRVPLRNGHRIVTGHADDGRTKPNASCRYAPERVFCTVLNRKQPVRFEQRRQARRGTIT